MSSLIKIGIKDRNGKYKNYIVSVSDNVDQYGNNVAMYVEQTKEEREAKARRTYVGNGKVIWTDGTIEVAPKNNVDFSTQESKDNNVDSNANSTITHESPLNELKNEPTETPVSVSDENESDDLPF